MLSPQDEEFLKAVHDGLKISFGAKTGDIRELLRIVGELKSELRAVTEDMILAVDARSRAEKERDGLKEVLNQIASGSPHLDSDISGEGCDCLEKFAQKALAS